MFVKSKVLLLGSGGVGTIVALNLESGGMAAVTAVLRSNYEQVTRKGFTIHSCDHGDVEGWRPSQILDHVPSPPDNQIFDYIVCTAKNIPDCSPTLPEIIAPAVTPNHTTIVLLQNGINIEQAMFQAFPSNIVLSGISYIRSHEVYPGTIDHMDHDELVLGAFANPNLSQYQQEATARQFCEMYAAGNKTRCVYDTDVRASRWRKLMYNACLNSICAVTRLDTGRLQQTGSLIEGLVRPAMREIVAAARAAGVELPDNITDSTIAHLEPVDMHFAPSMLVDVEKGNFTEFENIVGEPLRMGTALGVSMPTLHVVYHILKASQWRLKEQRELLAQKM